MLAVAAIPRVPLPVPLAPLVIVSHVAELDAVQPQLLAVETVAEPELAVAGILNNVGDNV